MTAIATLINRPCTLHTRVEGAPDDDMGDPVVTWTDVATVCELQQSSTTELRDGRLVLVSTWNLYLLPDEALTGWDEVTIDGTRYATEGRPWPARNPQTQVFSHIEARLREVV